MSGIILNYKYLVTDIKARIYKSALQPILTYEDKVMPETVKRKTQSLSNREKGHMKNSRKIQMGSN